jgi:hypothetical protein
MYNTNLLDQHIEILWDFWCEACYNHSVSQRPSRGIFVIFMALIIGFDPMMAGFMSWKSYHWTWEFGESCYLREVSIIFNNVGGLRIYEFTYQWQPWPEQYRANLWEQHQSGTAWHPSSLIYKSDRPPAFMRESVTAAWRDRTRKHYCEKKEEVAYLLRGRLEPRRRSAGVWESRGWYALSVWMKATHFVLGWSRWWE